MAWRRACSILLLAASLAGCGDTAQRPAARVPGVRPDAPYPSPRHGRAPGRPVGVTVTASPAGPPVARDFLGLSFEARDLPALAADAGRGDLVTLLRSLGPAVMRFGGVTADTQTVYAAPGRPPPPGMRAITRGDLRRLGTLAARTGWRVLLAADLAHDPPRVVARETADAAAALGPRLEGIELGNEPDSFVSERLRGASWGFAAYRAQVDADRAAIRAAAPRVALAGPDASSGIFPLRWTRAEVAAEHPALVTAHFYPSTHCGYTPAVSDLLSPRTRRIETHMVERLAAIARAARRPLRLDETNDISCGGQAGVSDSLASALWAVDYIARAMSAGLAGINLHDLVRQPDSYAPLAANGEAALRRGAIHPRAKWYALLAARALAGSRPARCAGPRAGAALTAHCFLAADGRLRVVLTDFSATAGDRLRVVLRAPARYAGGTVVRLRGPGPAATAGIRLTRPGRLRGRAGRLELTVPPASAAVVTLDPRSARR